jgi:hypothetical protein
MLERLAAARPKCPAGLRCWRQASGASPPRYTSLR